MSDSTTNLDQIQQSQSQKEVTANALFDAASPATGFGRRASTCAGLTWGYYGGVIAVAGVLTTIPNGTLTLAASSTNYVEVSAAGVVSSNTTGFTAGRTPLYTVITSASLPSSYVDKRLSAAAAASAAAITFVASGTGHAGGLVPDPGSIAGTTRFLCEDATFKTVPAGAISGAITVASLPGTTFDITRHTQYWIAANVMGFASVGGITPSITGSTLGNTALVGSTVFNSTHKFGYGTAAAINATAGAAFQGADCVLGTVSGMAGFVLVLQWCNGTMTASARCFHGLTTLDGTLLSASAEPSAALNTFGVGSDSTDTGNLQLIHNDGAGTATKLDLGSNFPARSASTDVYRLTLTCAGGVSSITYLLQNLTTGLSTTGTVTTDIPAGSTVLRPQTFVNTGPSVATACQIYFMRGMLQSSM